MTENTIRAYAGGFEVTIGNSDFFFATLAEAETFAAKSDAEVEEAIEDFWAELA